jgi:phosphatidate cytidylyltransferase
MSISWTPVPVVLLGIVALLSLASLAVWRRREPNGELALRVRSWWVIVSLGATALLLGRFSITVFLALVSFLALKEYLSVIPTRRADRRVLIWAYLAIPVQYALVHAGNYTLAISFVPVYLFLFLSAVLVLTGETGNYLIAVSTLFWGLMLTVFCLSHLAMLFAMPGNSEGASLLLYLVLMTQVGDVAQYLWGKQYGKRLVLPSVSPSKTVEGLIGGIITITLLSGLLGPYLTPMSWSLALAGGCLIAVSGFFGDVTVSALKRDLGIKDSSSFIPGHGGILDRVDSLTYTAPLFFHLIRFFYGSP